MNSKKKLNLHLFDGEGAVGGATATAGDAGTGMAEAAPAEKTKARGRSANPLANVQYGKAAEADALTPAEPEANRAIEPPIAATDEAINQKGIGLQDSQLTPEQRKAEFEKLIKGEYRDAFSERTQEIINNRFRETKGMEQQLGAMKPILDVLAEKYGVQPDDVQGLQKALSEDQSLYEEEAERRGISVEQLKEIKRLERENEGFKRAQAEQERQVGLQEASRRLQQQVQETQSIYNGFDLTAELNHPETGERFAALLGSGVDAKTAYEVIHMNELVTGAMGYAVKTAQQKTVNDIRARGMRPSENGASGSAPAQIVKNDPSKFTRADREEIARRVRRGEKIVL